MLEQQIFGADKFFMDSQNPPELEAPFLASGEEKEARVVDPGMQDLQTNIF